MENVAKMLLKEISISIVNVKYEKIIHYSKSQNLKNKKVQVVALLKFYFGSHHQFDIVPW